MTVALRFASETIREDDGTRWLSDYSESLIVPLSTIENYKYGTVYNRQRNRYKTV